MFKALFLYKLHRLFSILLIFLYATSIIGQEKLTDFNLELNSLLNKRPKSYDSIDENLRPFMLNIVLMNQLDSMATKINYPELQSYALFQLGKYYSANSMPTKSLNSFQKLKAITEITNDLELRVTYLNKIGLLFSENNAIKSALDYSQEALDLAETAVEKTVNIKKNIILSLNNIGTIYLQLEQFDLAISKFEQSNSIAKDLNDKENLAFSHLQLGMAYEAQGKLNPALLYFRQALAYSEQKNLESIKIKTNYGIGHIMVHLGKLNEGLPLLHSTLKSSKNLNDIPLISTLYTNLGWAYTQKGDFPNALVYLENGIEIAQQNNLISELAEGYKFLSELYIKKDDFEKAMSFYKKSKKYEERRLNNLNLRYVNDMIIKNEAQMRAAQLEKLEAENENVRIKLKKNKTFLLIIGLGILLLAGIFFIFYRQYQLNNEKKLLTLEQTMLRSQMNPHFLFNSLNSIKLYIINNEKKNAVHYLNKFSKLVRKILEASSQREISLADELETVELYMNIENIRFSNEINFKTKIDKDIDVHTAKIPSLILQPFLENSLWHGLSSKEGEKNILLEVKKGQQGYIQIIITDNGVGRNEAERIKERKVLKRKSIGIDITTERLENFSRDYQNSFNVEIIDKFDKNNNATGTQIILNIPTF